MSSFDENLGLKIVWGLNILWFSIMVLITITPYLASINSPIAGFFYLLFKPTCHQMSVRSFFLWEQKMPVCARCAGIYLSMLFFGLAFSAALYRKRIKPISTRIFLFFLIPIAIDGSTQIIGLRESTNLLRFITGGFAALGTVWFVYPQLWRINRIYKHLVENHCSVEKNKIHQT